MYQKILLIARVPLLGVLFVFMVGCEFLNDSLRSEPAADAGFINHPEDMTSDNKRFPFDRVWCEKHGCDWSKYSSIIVTKVDTSHVLKMSWWDNFNLEPKSTLQEERHVIANYLQETFKSSIRTDVTAHHEVVDEPTGRTMILEMALVELVPTKAIMRAAVDFIGYLIPGVSTLGLTGSGSVAIEGRIRDAETGHVIFKFADRQQDKTAAVSVEDFTWHGHAREIIDDWAVEFVELYDTPPSHMVRVASRFTLKPW